MAQPPQHVSGKIYHRNAFMHFLQKRLTNWLLRHIDVEFRDFDKLPSSGSFIMVANHETIIDGFLIAAGLNEQQLTNFHCLAGSDLAHNYGILGILALYMGQAVPIDRHGNPIKGMYKAKELLERGNRSLLIFPEGTRSVDGKLGEFHGGASLLVKNAKLPLLPIFIDGAYEVYNRYYKFPHFKSKGKRHKVIITCGSPLDLSDCKRTKDITAKIAAWYQAAFQAKEVPRDYLNLPPFNNETKK